MQLAFDIVKVAAPMLAGIGTVLVWFGVYRTRFADLTELTKRNTADIAALNVKLSELHMQAAQAAQHRVETARYIALTDKHTERIDKMEHQISSDMAQIRQDIALIKQYLEFFKGRTNQQN